MKQTVYRCVWTQGNGSENKYTAGVTNKNTAGVTNKYRAGVTNKYTAGVTNSLNLEVRHPRCVVE